MEDSQMSLLKNQFGKRIILEEIVDGNVDLINGRGKMEDLTLGDAIDWPEFRIISI